MFASRPLADYQAEADRNEGETRAVAASPEPVQRPREVPVVDIHFDDLPDQEYAEFSFPLKTVPGVVFTLGIDDDAVLFQLADVANEGTLNDIISFVFKSTFRRAVDEYGNEVEHGLRLLMNAMTKGKPGERESRRYLMSVVNTAVEQWSEELTDTSMRPANRAQRRARRR